MRARDARFLPPLLMTVMLAIFGFGAGACGDGGSAGGSGPGPDRRRADRARMVAEVERDCARLGDVLGRRHLDPAVRDALLDVPRHVFIPPEFGRVAYVNNALPIGHDQTISQPTIVALMTDLLRVGPGDTVLEVGTGSGYQAAVLARVCAHVHTIEIVRPLARSARARLARLGYDNVTVYEGDGWRGVPEHAPYAGIIVTAAPDRVPRALLDQLAPGGRLVLPVGPVGGVQEMVVVSKSADGSLSSREVLPVRFVPLTGGGGD